MVRIAKLEDEKAALEAERDMWKHACKSWEEQNVRLVSLVAKTEAERDKLQADADYWMKRATRNL
jgi:hypothetical protein